MCAEYTQLSGCPIPQRQPEKHPHHAAAQNRAAQNVSQISFRLPYQQTRAVQAA
nr:hypothetical protein [uncultured Kingella sp.]